MLIGCYLFLREKLTQWAQQLISQRQTEQTFDNDSLFVEPNDTTIAYTDALTQADAQTDTDEQAVADNQTAEGESAETNDGTEPETMQTDEPEQRVYEDFLGTITLNKGSRLAHLARKYYGSPYFWVYLYEANKEVIPNPNVIPNGTKIRIPNLPPSMVDPNDPKAIERAKQIEKEILGEQK